MACIFKLANEIRIYTTLLYHSREAVKVIGQSSILLKPPTVKGIVGPLRTSYNLPDFDPNFTGD